jgi:hypothetical protein
MEWNGRFFISDLMERLRNSLVFKLDVKWRACLIAYYYGNG